MIEIDKGWNWRCFGLGAGIEHCFWYEDFTLHGWVQIGFFDLYWEYYRKRKARSGP